MDFIHNITEGRSFNIEALRSILDESLNEEDFFCRKSCRLLNNVGLEKNEALMLLAQYKSKIKYGYDLSISTLSHILRVSKNDKKETSIKKLVESPFFLVKACWLYDHAPNFYFFNGYKPKDLDDFIIKFAKEYDTQFLNNKVSVEKWKKINKPRRVLASSFWEKDIINPILFIEKVINQNIEGIEISFDFHPFNYTKLLPEELSIEKRELINEARRKSGIKIDIHGPIVGPYFPLPIPRKGRQLFNNPLKCFGLQCETIELAKDIGAGSVVVHLIDSSNPKKMSDLIMQAGGSNTRVTIENYCQTKELQNSDNFLAYIDEIFKNLPKEVRRNNFGITLDVGHLNIEGEDPLVASDKIGCWCHDNGVYLRIHATDNYGNLPFTPPSYSADIHNNVSGLGINNEAIIKLLRSKGLRFDVVAEQIKPLTPEDIAIIHKAQSTPLDKSYDEFLLKGKEILSAARFEELITPAVMKENPYLFLAGLEGTDALKEYLVYRKIQERKYLFVDDAKKISQDFMKMPQKIKNHLIRYLDDLLLPIQDENGAVSKNQLGLICQNISGALFGTINNEHLSQIFSQSRTYKKGDVICRQNTIGHEMYFIEEGEVNIFVKGSLISSLAPGEIFGEISLFYNIKRTATIKAAKDNTKVRILSRKSFMNLIRRNQPYSYDLIYRLYHVLPERLRNLIDKYKASVDSIHLILDRENDVETSVEEVPLDMGLKTDIIPPFSQEEAEMLFKQKKEFDADQVIFSEGDEGDCVFYILDGRVKVVTRSSTNKEIKYGELGEGEVFGEMALMDNKPRSASIVAMTPCKTAYIEKNDFIDLLDTRSELAFRLLAYTCVSILERILRLDKVYSEIKNWVENYKTLHTHWTLS
jgi:CRP-like cAMP-binding protein/sugar phosphate isomerase/epimerase